MSHLDPALVKAAKERRRTIQAKEQAQLAVEVEKQKERDKIKELQGDGDGKEESAETGDIPREPASLSSDRSSVNQTQAQEQKVAGSKEQTSENLTSNGISSGLQNSRDRALLKIIVLGSSNVGKTSLMKRYVSGDFTGQRRPTIGADFMSKEVVLGGTPALLQIWDTAGQERFHQGALGYGFYRGASAALIVYDVTSTQSLKQVNMWKDELSERLGLANDPNHPFPIVVLANKVDLPSESHQVDREEVAAECLRGGMGHLETSAKDGGGVEVAMTAVAMLALEEKRYQERRRLLSPGENTLSLGGGSDTNRKNKGGCCQ